MDVIIFVFVGLIGALLFAIGFWVGRVGRVRRVGHLIFKKKMPESFAHERCLDHLMRNFSAKLLADGVAKS
jgi:hypothetical protein